MAEQCEKAYAKLNLTLDVLRRREDGYHDLRMIMQSISLCDTITVTETSEQGIRLRSNANFLPRDHTNLAVKAAMAFFAAVEKTEYGISITMEKKIPVCAGMAGGSSDAAAVLRVLRNWYRPEMSMEELCCIGERVGSDVPYCVFGGTALAEGRGERLTRLAPMPACYAVICKPPFPISTPELFGCIRPNEIRLHPDTAGMIRGLEEQDLSLVAHSIYNVFEPVLPKKYAAVSAIHETLLDLGALNACMSGSGPTVFGVFAEKAKAESAYTALKKNYDQTYLATMINAE